MPLLSLSRVSLSFGGQPLQRGVVDRRGPEPVLRVNAPCLKRAAPHGYADAAAALRAPPSPLAAWIAKPPGEQEFLVE